MSDVPLPRRTADGQSLIGGAIAGIVLMLAMLISVASSNEWDKLSHMWLLGIIFSFMSGLYCLQYFSARCAAIVMLTVVIPFLLCSLIASAIF